MFLIDADMDKTCLRQGDILKKVLYPLIVLSDARFLGSVGQSGDLRVPIKAERQAATVEPPEQPMEDVEALRVRAEEVNVRNSPAWMCQLFARIGFAAVISQCCDIEPKDNKITRQPAIALARLIPVPLGPAKDPIKLASLKANKNPTVPGNTGYINYFYLPASERLDGKDWVVDYSQVLSIPATEFPDILERKILQMTVDGRIRFKIKLAASFGRLMPEEEEIGHPWLGDQAPDA